MAPIPSVRIDREASQQRLDLLSHRRLGRFIGLSALGRQRIQHFDDQFADVFELRHAEAAVRQKVKVLLARFPIYPD